MQVRSRVHQRGQILPQVRRLEFRSRSPWALFLLWHELQPKKGKKDILWTIFHCVSTIQNWPTCDITFSPFKKWDWCCCFSCICERLDIMCRVHPFQCICQMSWRITGGCRLLQTARPRYVPLHGSMTLLEDTLLKFNPVSYLLHLCIHTSLTSSSGPTHAVGKTQILWSYLQWFDLGFCSFHCLLLLWEVCDKFMINIIHILVCLPTGHCNCCCMPCRYHHIFYISALCLPAKPVIIFLLLWRQVYSLMKECWAYDYENRPCFSILGNQIETIMQDERENPKS